MLLQESVVGGCGFDRDALLEVEKATVPSDLMICCSGDERNPTWRARRLIYTSRTPALSACRAKPRRCPKCDSSITYAQSPLSTELRQHRLLFQDRHAAFHEYSRIKPLSRLVRHALALGTAR